MKKFTLIALLFIFHLNQQTFSQSDKLVNSSISIMGDSEGVFINTIAAVINSVFFDEEDCYNYYNFEQDCNKVNGKRMFVGGEFKLNFNLHQHFSLYGGYRMLSIPFDLYGKEIISRGFFVEPHINFSDDIEQTTYIFGQFGKTAFNQKEIINHRQYTFGLGYKYEGTSIDFGYNLFNKPLEQEQEFFLNDNLVQTETSFLTNGYAMIRFTAELF